MALEIVGFVSSSIVTHGNVTVLVVDTPLNAPSCQPRPIRSSPFLTCSRTNTIEPPPKQAVRRQHPP